MFCVVLGRFRWLVDVQCVFVASSFFKFVLSFASFSSALSPNVIQIACVWLSFVSGCYIGYFRLFTLCKFIEVAYVFFVFEKLFQVVQLC